MRLGYLISGNAQLIEGIRRAGQAWPVSSVAEAAGIAAAMAVKNEAVRFNEIDGTAVRREIRLPDKF